MQLAVYRLITEISGDLRRGGAQGNSRRHTWQARGAVRFVSWDNRLITEISVDIRRGRSVGYFAAPGMASEGDLSKGRGMEKTHRWVRLGYILSIAE